ncbi:glycosyltransferase family 4 protein [Pleurocapsales cyanobacterium LEGE 10410]|nr:glycosyltransferase family 4 protein [Pleurocapsales cyanobacterium LEGE 10410]
MRIFYDGKIFKTQAAGGISRYFSNLINRLPQNFIPCLTISQRHNSLFPSHPKLKIWKYKPFSPSDFSRKVEKYYFQSVATLNNYDLAHPTYYSLLTRQEMSKYRSPIVLTVYDLIHEIFSNQLDPSGKHIEHKRKAIRAAQKIICISENTKKDLINWYSVPEEKISVTYLASSIDASLSHGVEEVPCRPYYLYVGSRDAYYKNFDTLLFALAKVVSVQPEIRLCIVGESLNQTEIKLIAELNLSNSIEHYGYASDTHLAKLYRCSIAFVYPSLYEGFGIPPLEAMSCGTVVVVSNNSSIPEVVGDAGILFNPKATKDLADILLSLLDRSAKRDRLIVKGYQRAKAFSWDKTVSQTLDVYNSVRKNDY